MNPNLDPQVPTRFRLMISQLNLTTAKRFLRWVTIVLLPGLLLITGGRLAYCQTQFIPLGFLDGFGPTSEAATMSDDGLTILGYSTTSLTQNQAAIWTASSPANWLVDGRIRSC